MYEEDPKQQRLVASLLGRPLCKYQMKKKLKEHSYRQSHTGPETGPKKKYSVHATLDSDGMKTSVGMVKSNRLTEEMKSIETKGPIHQAVR